MKKGKKNKNNIAKNILIFILVFFILAAMLSWSSKNSSKSSVVGLSSVALDINNEKIESIQVEGSKMAVKYKDGHEAKAIKEVNQSLSQALSDFGVDKNKMSNVKIDIKDSSESDVWMTIILPFLVPLVLIGVMLWFMMRGVQGANNKAMMFGQSGAREANPDNQVKTTFADVAGAKEAKEELMEVVEFLKAPKKFADLGARIPRGVLLLGGPGLGKTLLAKAVAGEAAVPFFSISGSEFVEMFVGVGASRVRDLFAKAKKRAPCIVFIDEIDAVGRRRGTGLGGSHDEREQTLNQILVEMDGFEPNSGVIVIAATNRPDVLDPALLRPGRFDRQVMLDAPDIADREAILKIHARQKPLADGVELRRVAERTPGFSGADLANVLNEGAILAARHNKKKIDSQELFDAIEKVILGPERKSRIITDKEKKTVAYHEAGHAVLSYFLGDANQTHKVSIISRGQAGGYTLRLPTEDKHLHSRSEYFDELGVMLGGYLAEIEVFGEMTTGASSDLQRVTELAKNMVTQFGMSDNLGPRTFGKRDDMIFLGKEIHEERDYSEKLAETIDSEVASVIKQAQEKAKGILINKRAALEKVVAVLLEKETIEKDEFAELMKEFS
ncbi:MAG: ATP-dependent zinc metalloprotease FtsH [Patescibacteria group bacterium]|nr:ATP-dependent zinc metalloprotease FtsH [Patescibacteria group bacterium]